MNLPRIQYITHPEENFEDLSWVHRLHEGGVRWIQLRIKENDFYAKYPNSHYKVKLIEIADTLRAMTNSLDMFLTINDHESIVPFVLADGVHVGKEDNEIEEVREVVGQNCIVGATANSLSEILAYDVEKVDYLGVGPLRYTTTKEKLKPVIGFSGYESIINELNQSNTKIPVFAIGGIVINDIEQLMNIGVYGIALSGLIFNNKHSVPDIRSIVNEIEKSHKKIEHE